MTVPRPPLPELVEVALFGPLGVMLAVLDNFPSIKPIGRADVLQQIRSARMIGTMTVAQARREVERRMAEPRPAMAVVETVVVAPLPLENYDRLTAAQVLPLLAGLSQAERDRLEDHETSHRNRRTVITRLDQLRT